MISLEFTCVVPYCPPEKSTVCTPTNKCQLLYPFKIFASVMGKVIFHCFSLYLITSEILNISLVSQLHFFYEVLVCVLCTHLSWGAHLVAFW